MGTASELVARAAQHEQKAKKASQDPADADAEQKVPERPAGDRADEQPERHEEQDVAPARREEPIPRRRHR